MVDRSRVLDLLLLWEESRDAGRDVTPEELCADHPELLDLVAVEIHRVLRLDERLKMADDDAPALISGTSSPQAGTTIEAGSAAPSSPPDVPGYQIVSILGRGGMGIVYRARDIAFDREVAIKVVADHWPADSNIADRFIQEAKITAQLQHPGIPACFRIGSLPGGRPYLAMKLIKGRTLDELLKEATALNLLAVFEAICQTVGYAHAHRVIHRDLKPLNVMVGGFGEVQVMDWGLAKVLSDAVVTSNDVAPKATEIRSVRAMETGVGNAVGTLAFMPPEQAAGENERIDQRSDVFGLGAILCVMLTGKPPYTGKDSEAIRIAALRGNLAPAYARLDACAAEPGLITLAKRCLAFEPSERPADGQAVAEAVAKLRGDAERRARDAEVEQAKAEVKAAEQRRRRKVQTALAASVLVLLFGFGVAGWWYDRQETLKRERHSRETEQLNAALERTEMALRADDAVTAAIYFQQAETPMASGGHEVQRPRFEQYKKDLAMLQELDRIEDFNWTHYGNQARQERLVATRWAKAFADFGIIPGATSPEEAASTIRASAIVNRLLVVLDRWHLFFESSPLIAAIVTAADADPFREALRRAVEAKDLKRQKELAALPEAINQPERFSLILGGLDSLSIIERQHYLHLVHQRNPKDFHVLMLLGGLYPTNTPENALQRAGWFRAALALRPSNAAAWNNLGTALVDNRDLDGAIAAYKKSLQFDPKDAVGHHNLGLVLHELKDLNGAIVELNEAIRLDPNSPDAHSMLGRVLLDKDVDRAIDELRVAIQIDPSYAGAYQNLGEALRIKNDLVGAIEAHEKAIFLFARDAQKNRDNLDRGLATGHIGLGQDFLAKKEPDRAIAEFNIAIRLGSKSADLYGILGEALFQQDDLDGGIAACKEAVRIDPKIALTHQKLGGALAVNQQLKAAIVEFEEAVRLDRPLAVAHFALAGSALIQNQQIQAAIVEFKEAVRLDRPHTVAQGGLGAALYQARDLLGAKAALNQAILLDPADSDSYLLLADTLRDLGQFAAARDELVKARKHLPADSPNKASIEDGLRKVDELLATEKRLPDVLSSKAKARDSAESIRFAEICGYKRRYLLALRFYAEAVAADAKLEADPLLEHRYAAACHAVLTAEGKGIDPLGVERPEMRRQARDLLAADLTAWTKLFDQAPEENRAKVHEHMKHWLGDSDLAGIRDAEQLNALHPDERTVFERLWRDVRALRDRTAPPERLPAPREFSGNSRPSS